MTRLADEFDPLNPALSDVLATTTHFPTDVNMTSGLLGSGMVQDVVPCSDTE